jgi:DNA helicase-2/ATP-dependent DNA helicase PcrA
LLGESAWQAAAPPARLAAKSGLQAYGRGALPFRIGQNVTHPKFGAGVIVNAEGSGADARLQVNFGNQGMKWLQMGYAKLTAA